MAIATTSLIQPNETAQPSGNLKAIAVVDWVAFIVRLKRASNPGVLKRKYESIGVSRFEPMDLGPGSAATTFRVVLQHPSKYNVINDLIVDLAGSNGLSETPSSLQGLEVSVDFWPTRDDASVGADITKRLMMELTPPILNNPRLANNIRSIIWPTGSDISTDYSLYIGNNDDDLMWRVYWKRTDETFVGDDGKRVPKQLPESEWRARAEVRLQGDALASLSLITPMDLETLRFEKLYSVGYFRFCQHATGSDIIASNRFALWAAQKLGVDHESPACMLGKFGCKDCRGRTKKLSSNLLTDAELSDAARSALRGLTRRFG